MSGGGPAAYCLAGRYPDQVSCLLQIDSIALPLPPSRVERLAFSVRPLLALQLWLVEHMPGGMLAMMGGTRPADPEAANAQQSLLRAVITSCGDWASMRAGYDNDEAEFAALAPLPLGAITCPTLIVHGSADTSVPTSHSEHAHHAIAGSRLRWIPDGRHAAFWFTPEVQQDALAFLLDHLVE
jgi:pimeloyl-ACP methyl ester carboxylesterase